MEIFFHFTHIKNLDSIIKNGILCTNIKNARGIQHENVASKGIQARRNDMDVTCGPKGKVHDYVPFYFTSMNPMFLSVINRKNQDQPFMIFSVYQLIKLKIKILCLLMHLQIQFHHQIFMKNQVI